MRVCLQYNGHPLAKCLSPLPFSGGKSSSSAFVCKEPSKVFACSDDHNFILCSSTSLLSVCARKVRQFLLPTRGKNGEYTQQGPLDAQSLLCGCWKYHLGHFQLDLLGWATYLDVPPSWDDEEIVILLWVQTLYPWCQNRWYMSVHPPQNGGIGYDPWPYLWLT